MSKLHYHVNGKLVPAAEARISVRDRGFLYGDAAFETLRVYDGTIFEWEAHRDRLNGTCGILGMDFDISEAGLRQRIEDTLAVNEFDDAYARVSVTRGVQPGKLNPEPLTDPGIVIIVAELPPGGTGSDPIWDRPAVTMIAETQRIPNTAVPSAAKTHNYLNGILARLEAVATGADEAIMLDGSGSVTEGATSNCFFVRDGTLHTPSLDGPILPGITRRVVLQLANEGGIPTRTGSYTPTEFREADEGFLTNTTWEIRPIDSIDGVAIGEGPVTETLREAFDSTIDSFVRDDR